MIEELPVARPGELATRAPEARWLIRELWARDAAGILAAHPKSAKSWLGLEMAVSVASATDCLGHFPVDHAGPVLVYLAEDALPEVRARIEALAAHRGLTLDALDLHVITAPTLRLDLEEDRARLTRTLERLRPHLVVLDPLIRMHRLNENDSAEIAKLLGELRAIQRTYELALVLVHHVAKRAYAQPGQALRGSSDLWAFGDTNLYLKRHGATIELTVEHRSAPAPAPLKLELRSRADGSATHLALCDDVARSEDRGGDAPALEELVLAELRRTSGPATRVTLRDRLRVKNQRLGEALLALERRGEVERSPRGWSALAAVGQRADDDLPPQPNLPI